MSTQNDYINHSLNKSKTKFACSFSKNRRFKPDLSPKSIDLTYNLPNTRATRTCTFGFGNKIQFADRTFGPPPNRYSLKSDFEKTLTKGFSFGSGRQQTIFGSQLSPKKKSAVPGPGQYPIPSCLANNNIYMGIKLNQQSSKKTAAYPGPGTYNIDQTQVKMSGHYILTNFRNPLSPKYVTGKTNSSKSFVIKQKSLGPGYYPSTDALSPQGKYISSKFKASKVRSFSKSKRLSLAGTLKKQFPGPGSYELFSEFGNIKIKNLDKAKFEIKIAK